MKAEELMDAIGELPNDLITAAEKCRTAAPVRSRNRHWGALAACAALMIGLGILYQSDIYPKKSEPIRMESAAPALSEVMMEEMLDQPAAEVPAAIAGQTPETDEAIFRDDHTHSFARETEPAEPNASNGDLTVIVRIDDNAYTVSGRDAALLTDILTGLSYDPNALCRCIAPIQVDTESIAGISVNPDEGFARCELGQAQLTETQVQQIRKILDNLT